MTEIRIDTDVLKTGGNQLNDASARLSEIKNEISRLSNGIDHGKYDGQFAKKVSDILAGLPNQSNELGDELQKIARQLIDYAQTVEDIHAINRAKHLGIEIKLSDLIVGSPTMAWFARWKAGDFVFTGSPVPLGKNDKAQYFGDTEFASTYKGYAVFGNKHSGVDFIVKKGTDIYNTTNKKGKVIAVNGKPISYGANPSILVDYEDTGYLVLYGHVMGDEGTVVNLPKLGHEVLPNEKIGVSGISNNIDHIHLELIPKPPGWESMSDKEKIIASGAAKRRINPIPFLDPVTLKSFTEAAQRNFSGGKFNSGDAYNQPDVTSIPNPSN